MDVPSFTRVTHTHCFTTKNSSSSSSSSSSSNSSSNSSSSIVAEIPNVTDTHQKNE
jgi:hypothetical protein